MLWGRDYPNTAVDNFMVGGNDLARGPFSPRQISHLFEELVLGLIAAGAGEVHIFPVPHVQRAVCRHGEVSVSL